MTDNPPPISTSLYEAHKKVYPREVSGRFQRLRVAAVIALLGLFYLVPWLTWEGRQAVLFDLPARKFYIFELVFFPQDFFLLTWLLIIAALSLFFFTALAGRLWCGYACPQTVWTEVFLWMERLTEGTRQKRIKLDKGPWTREKILRKSAKQFLWVMFSLYTGFTFVGYFTPVQTLLAELQRLAIGPWEAFWGLFYGFATYGNAGYLREQVCKYMCPYARFQSAMFDRSTLVISYDAQRGEPRGARARGVDPQSKGLGSCIDCKVCVQVCPTDIDIRKGLQYECIGCTACIDACDDIMDKMGYPRGLIRYTTQNAMEGQPTRVWRPRTLVYGTLLLALVVGFFVAVAQRDLIEMEALRDRNALYRTLDDGRIENVYSLRLVNKDTHAHEVTFSVTGIEGAKIDTGAPTHHIPAGETRMIAARVQVLSGQVSGGRDIQIIARSADAGPIDVQTKARYFAPVP